MGRRPAWAKRVRSGVFLLLLSVSLARAEDPQPKPLLCRVRLSLTSPARLSVSEIQFAAFPAGKRCAFTYTGPRSPKTVSFFSKIGFRTTIYLSPQTPPERVRALEAAGAEIGVRPWGCKGTYQSIIGANTIQETFDALVTSRLTLRKAGAGPMACAAISGHYGVERFPLNRRMADPDGYGAAFQDSNYLLLSDNKPYMIYLRREGIDRLATRSNFDNTMQARKVPNETVYYQILAHQFLGTLRRVKKGQVVRFSMRDFKALDLEEIREVMGPYGNHNLIWHASEGEIGAYEYIRNKARVLRIEKLGDGELEILVGIDADTFPPFLLAPLSLKLPKRLALKSARVGTTACRVTAQKDAVYLDIPLRQAFQAGCAMRLRTAAPDVSIPASMEITLALRSKMDKPLQKARLQWRAPRGITIRGGESEAFRLEPGAERIVRATLETSRAARFGVAPIRAVVTGQVGGEARVFAEGFEVVVAPRLRVEMDPAQRIPLPKGHSQHIRIHLANGKRSRPGGPLDKFISHSAGPCKGVVRFNLPKDMEAIPREQPFQMAADSETTLVFKIRSHGWSRRPTRIKPVILFEGETEPLEVLVPGLLVIRKEATLAYEPLDDKGLLVQASWDDKRKRGSYDRAAGNPNVITHGGAPCTYSNEGIQGWCLTARTGVMFDSYKNIDHRAGTILFWMRKDPRIRNENQFHPDPKQTWKDGASAWNNRGEVIFGFNKFPQRMPNSQSGIGLRRLPGWGGKDGYLQATYQGLGRQMHYVQVPFNGRETWRHVAVLWSMNERRLEIYLDGKLAGKADPGRTEWYGAPWDRGGPSGAAFQPISMDHGKWCGTQRDELYIYNRALAPREIQENMQRAKK